VAVESRHTRDVDALLRERVEQLASLSGLSNAVARAGSLEQTYEAALDCLAQTLSPDRASVLLFDDDGVLRFKAWRRLSDDYRRATEGHTPWSPDTKGPQPVLVPEVAGEPSLAELRPVIEREGIQALAFFPLLTGERLLGKFMVYFDQPHVFTPSEVRLAEAIGAHIALEIARRRAEEDSRRQTALLMAQTELTAEGVLVVGPDGRVISFNQAFARMWGLDPELFGTAPLADRLAAVAERVADPESFLARVARLQEHPDEPARDELELRDGRVFERQTSPIRGADGERYGRVWFFHDVTARRHAHEHAALLAAASDVLGSSLDFRATLQRLAELLVESLAASCAVELLGDAGARLAASATSGAAAASGEEGTVVVAPVAAGGRELGTITVTARAGRRFAEAEIEVVRDVARRAGLAVENGLLHEAERRSRDSAERLQTLSDSLARAVTQREIAELVVREGAVALGAAAGWISRVDAEAGVLRKLAAIGYRPDLDEAYSVLPLERGNPTVDALLDERPLWLASAAAVVDAYPGLARDYPETGFEAMTIVPVSVLGRATGVIALNFTEVRSFDEEQKRLLAAVAAQCGLALERAALFGELQERADAASVLAHVGDGVFQLDDEERVTLWNRGAEVLTGIPEGEAVGERIEALIRGWGAIRPLISITDVPVAVGRREALPATIRGRERWLAISGVATGDGVVYAFRDVTDAERLEKARRDFLATVSHELRTPLAAVFGATKTLLHHELDESTRSTLLRVIDSESERLASILDDILVASRLDDGKLQLETTSFDPAALVAEVVELEQRRAPDGIALRLEDADGVPPVVADPSKLRQVLVNLVDNAIKYSPAGGTVRVSLAPADGVVRIAVADEGLGIPRDEHERIFEKFYRLDPDLSRGVGGTGLGLYICREFVERMGGRISVASEEGDGSTFFLELPLASVEP
jgi:PAS domain S-box-containing protein